MWIEGDLNICVNVYMYMYIYIYIKNHIYTQELLPPLEHINIKCLNLVFFKQYYAHQHSLLQLMSLKILPLHRNVLHKHCLDFHKTVHCCVAKCVSFFSSYLVIPDNGTAERNM